MWRRQRAIQLWGFQYLSVTACWNSPLIVSLTACYSSISSSQLWSRCYSSLSCRAGRLVVPSHAERLYDMSHSETTRRISWKGSSKSVYVHCPVPRSGWYVVFKSLAATFYHSAWRYTWTWNDLKRPAYESGKVTFSIIVNLITLHFQTARRWKNYISPHRTCHRATRSMCHQWHLRHRNQRSHQSHQLQQSRHQSSRTVEFADLPFCDVDVLRWGQWIQWLVQQTLREAPLQCGCRVQWLIKFGGFQTCLKTIQVHYWCEGW